MVASRPSNVSSSSSGAAVYGRLVPEEQLAAIGRGLSVINPNAAASIGANAFPYQSISFNSSNNQQWYNQIMIKWIIIRIIILIIINTNNQGPDLCAFIGFIGPDDDDDINW